jgi:1,4-dihydroxy-2-naphthoyl-CoA hydrolase
MPVSHKTVQPFRILHGGASVALAETLGSVASNIIVSPDNLQIVGLEINANHLKSAKEGQIVTGRVSPIRIGRKIHVWQIEIRDEQEKLCCTSRLTVAVLN